MYDESTGEIPVGDEQTQDIEASGEVGYNPSALLRCRFLCRAAEDAGISIEQLVSAVQTGEINDDVVESYLSALHRLENEADVLRAQYEAKKSPLVSEMSQIEFHMAHRIEEYCRDKAQSQGKKTLNFWNGTCRFRRRGGGAVITDSEAALRYLKENGFDHMIVESVKVNDFKRYANDLLNDSGELIPGVDLEPIGENFSRSKPKSRSNEDAENSQ